MKSSVSNHHHHQANAAPDASNRALVGAPGVRGADGRPSKSDARGAISPDRLNAAQPPTPGSPAKPGQAALVKSPRDRGNVSGVGATNLPKRSSGLAAGINGAATPSASMQAQLKSSNVDLTTQSRPSPGPGALHSSQGAGLNGPQTAQPTFAQKIAKVFCCGGAR